MLLAQPVWSPLPFFLAGNISSKGERIYHVPGGAYYDRVSIEPGKGEKCFSRWVLHVTWQNLPKLANW